MPNPRLVVRLSQPRSLPFVSAPSARSFVILARPRGPAGPRREIGGAGPHVLAGHDVYVAMDREQEDAMATATQLPVPGIARAAGRTGEGPSTEHAPARRSVWALAALLGAM